MGNRIVSLAESKAHLSELTDIAATGETVIITKRGKPVARLSKAEAPREPVDLGQLQRLTEAMPRQSEDAGRFMRRTREEARY